MQLPPVTHRPNTHIWPGTNAMELAYHIYFATGAMAAAANGQRALARRRGQEARGFWQSYVNAKVRAATGR
jgi:hypothetical protein